MQSEPDTPAASPAEVRAEAAAGPQEMMAVLNSVLERLDAMNRVETQMSAMQARLATMELKERERGEATAQARRSEISVNPRATLPGGALYKRTSTEPVNLPEASPGPVPHRTGRLTLSPFDTPAAQRDDDDKQEQNRADGPTAVERAKAEERLRRRADGPPVFTGDRSKDKIADARDWVEQVDNWLDFMLGVHQDGVFCLSYVLTRLEGAAKDWLKAKKGTFVALTWGEVKLMLVDEFESPQYRQLKKLELEALRLGSHAHPTPILFNAAFDKLARILYTPASMSDAVELAASVDRTMADEYSKAVMRSHHTIWQDAVKMGPATLAQWKDCVTSQWSAREVIRQTTAGPRAGGADGGPRPYYGGWRDNRGAPNRPASLNEVQADTAPPAATAAPGAQPGEAPSGDVAVQLLQATAGPRGQRQPLLSDSEFQQVMREGRCLQCYKRGHRRGDNACKEKGKERRRPVQGELNA